MSTIATLLVGIVLGLLCGIGVMVALLRIRKPRSPALDEDSAGTHSAAANPNSAHVIGLQQSLLERAPIGVVALNASDDLVLANSRARELGALRRRRPVEPLLAIARAARTAGEFSQETTLSTGTLPPRIVYVRVSAIRLPRSIVALVVEDTTDARRVDVVRRDFVANVSHEIKTPVGALRLLAEAALESLAEVPDADQTRHFVERISHESARLGRLVSELLDLSRLQGAERAPDLSQVCLDDVVAEAIDRSSAPAEAKEITIVRGAPSSALVLGVETQLVTAVANLLDNAINYSPEGTRVAVAIKQADQRWELTVSDQGVGIPEADQDRIFERFYRVDPARSRATGGTGLGLAIVKHIVRNHGGDVRVWSAPGAGSSFTLCLPVVDGSAADRRSTSATQPAETYWSEGQSAEEDPTTVRSSEAVSMRGVR